MSRIAVWVLSVAFMLPLGALPTEAQAAAPNTTPTSLRAGNGNDTQFVAKGKKGKKGKKKGKKGGKKGKKGGKKGK